MKNPSQTLRCISSVVLASVAITAPVAAQVVTMEARITADNTYRLGYGSPFTPVAAAVENCNFSSEILSCNGGPEVYTFSPNLSDYLYIVAYDDDSGTQGLLGQFKVGTNPPIYTGTAWEVCATGKDFACGSGGPSVSQINAHIARCNAQDTTLPSRGWVSFTTPVPSRLEVGEPNGPSSPDVFSPVCTTNPNGIDPAASWMWYDWDPAPTNNWPNTTKPFEPGTLTPAEAEGEYLIFRLPVREVPGACPTLEVRYQYSAKFACYRAVEAPLALVKGYYGTAINVHEPRLTPGPNEKVRATHLAKKVAIALPGEKVGPVSRYRLETLGPDQAFEIDCEEIRKMSGVQGFITGFVVIDSDLPLDVTAIYTGRPQSQTGQVATMDVEIIPERKMDGTLTICP